MFKLYQTIRLGKDGKKEENNSAVGRVPFEIRAVDGAEQTAARQESDPDFGNRSSDNDPNQSGMPFAD